MKNRSGEKIKLASIDELLGVVNEESAMEIEISKIHPFKNHPFKVLDDEKMQDLVESVRINGVLTPVLLRMDDNEEYEMVSGHRRMHAAQLAGLTTIPAIVRELSDDDAVIAMVDANIQREELLPSEKAFAYKMKMDAMRRTAGRPTKENPRQNVGNYETADLIGKDNGESGRQVQRYIRLTELIPELLDLVDKKKLQFTVAIDISYIDKEVQEWIYEYISDTASNWYPASLVKKKFLMLTYSHIEYVLHCMRGNTTKVKNIKKYLLAALFNAPSTMNGYYQAEVNHDMPGLVR